MQRFVPNTYFKFTIMHISTYMLTVILHLIEMCKFQSEFETVFDFGLALVKIPIKK